MLTLPAFQYHAPTQVEEVLALLQAHPGKVKLIAGGTDLLPNMKHRLFTPAHVVGLKAVEGLAELTEAEGSLSIGAMVTIADLARDARVRARFPSLSEAASQIAGPQLREMGTVGGNLCLDTRCVYYNQTHFWRKALGYCLKKDGTVCHVVTAGRKCVAAASNDTAPVLMTLGALVRIADRSGEREVPINDFFVPDGIVNTILRADELVLGVRVPLPQGRVVMGYQKVRIRASIDYSSLTLAVAAELDAFQKVRWVKMTLSSLGARPHEVKRLEPFAGRSLDGATLKELGAIAHKQCHPLTNINVDPAWRREMIPIIVRRAFAQALGR